MTKNHTEVTTDAPQPDKDESLQDRVRAEQAELHGKLTALRSFFDGKVFPTLPTAEQERMRRQADCMSQYNDVLVERITAFC
jgi:hypothetical protein